MDDQKTLTLDGLKQYYVEVEEKMKSKTLLNFLMQIKYNQVIIFTSRIDRCKYLNKLLNKMEFNSIAIHAGLNQHKRIELYKQFKEGEKRILVATNLIARGIDIQRVNLVVNYDFAEDSATYLHRVGRAGRFNTKGIAVSFLAKEEDKKGMKEIEDNYNITITEMPKEIEESDLRGIKRISQLIYDVKRDIFILTK